MCLYLFNSSAWDFFSKIMHISLWQADKRCSLRAPVYQLMILYQCNRTSGSLVVNVLVLRLEDRYLWKTDSFESKSLLRQLTFCRWLPLQLPLFWDLGVPLKPCCLATGLVRVRLGGVYYHCRGTFLSLHQLGRRRKGQGDTQQISKRLLEHHSCHLHVSRGVQTWWENSLKISSAQCQRVCF